MSDAQNILRLDHMSKRQKDTQSEPLSGLVQDEPIFALDIGTRTVIGIVGIEKDEHYEILDAEVLEHASRAMLDGQIHDIGKVAVGAKRVKEKLEERLGFPLKKVAIAAAGRVLKTCQVRVDRDIDEGREIDQRMISALEMEGIQKAQSELETVILKNDKNPFYCVGYSVVNYTLNDFPIANLLGQKGYKIGMDVLATFLPHMVVDSLYTVMDRVGLEVSSITLEPIAALNVAIPRDLRLLNLALVDIGAGTSDIAITKGGTVIAYSMAPIAGDEVTECIAQHYLVDFNTAEGIKLAMSKPDKVITFTDILDNAMKVSAEEVQKAIAPVVQTLAKTIAERILEYNGGKSPNAVFLVGGGSQVFGLAHTISELLGLPKERVAVRNRSIAKNVTFDSDRLMGPECITPLGILVTASMLKGQDFFHVFVNGNKIKLYNSRKMSVSDALLLAGFNPDQLIGKSGKALRFILNGVEKTIRGGFGIPSEITVNDATANLTTTVQPGDRIVVNPAVRGTDAISTAGEHIGTTNAVRLQIGEAIFDVRPVLRINGTIVTEEYTIEEGDSLVVAPPDSIGEIAANFEIDTLRYTFLVNHQAVPLHMKPEPGMIVQCEEKCEQQALHMNETPASSDNQAVPEKAQDAIYHENHQILHDTVSTINQPATQDVQFNANQPTAQSAVFGVSSEMERAKEFDIEPVTPKAQDSLEGIVLSVNDKTVCLPHHNKDYMFVDIFNHIDFDLTNPQGVITLKLNGKDAGFTDVIKHGDRIELYWRES